MRKFFLLLWIVLIGAVMGQELDEPKADPRKIAVIRQIYKDVNAKIAEAKKPGDKARGSSIAVDEYKKNALNRSWEAVGNFSVVYRYYYTHGKEGNYPNTLVKITHHRKSAAREYYEEFYYGKNGDLVFYFQKTNDEDYPQQRRVYFSNGKAIRLIDDKYSRDGYTEGDKELVAALYKKSKAARAKFIQE